MTQKNIFYSFCLALFSFCTSPVKEKKESCLNQENFDKAYAYIGWKKQTSKKLSEKGHVLFDGGYELSLFEHEKTGKSIVFSKEGYKGFTVNVQQGFIPHTKVARYEKYEAVFCELVKVAGMRFL